MTRPVARAEFVRPRPIHGEAHGPFGGNAYLNDSTATGTITNDDHMPKAWLARFGRTVASQAVDAIGARLEGGAGSHVTVAGRSVPLAGQGAVAGRSEQAASLLKALASTDDAAHNGRAMTGREALLGTTFQLSSGGDAGGPAWTAWGRIATGGFEAEVDDTRLDGDVTSGFLGADVGGSRWLAGLALGTSKGEGDFELIEGGDGGSVESTLTAVYPYAQMGLSETVDIWGLAGFGSGELTLMRDMRRSARPGRQRSDEHQDRRSQIDQTPGGYRGCARLGWRRGPSHRRKQW